MSGADAVRVPGGPARPDGGSLTGVWTAVLTWLRVHRISGYQLPF